MRVVTIEDENFNHYRKPSMLIPAISCDFKCCKEAGVDKSMCQNAPLAYGTVRNVTPERLYQRYIENPITFAIVFAGLEPMLQTDEVLDVIKVFRAHGCFDDIVIYTGYNKSEVRNFISRVMHYPNITMKFGRYVPGSKPVYDIILGIALASANQYAERISHED